MLRRLMVLAGLLLWTGHAAAQAPCPNDFQGQTAAVTCSCATEAALSGSVWGTGTYTTDSRVCRAAVHAGAIPATGGVVVVTPAPGLSAYAGSAANGITTSNYGPWGASFTVVAPAAAAAACPATFQNESSALTCTCTTEAALSGTVWGSGTYTADSRICRAAIHAGAIPATGGVVVVTPAPGLTAYAGSAANGITTSNYGPWSASFTVAAPGVQAAACPANFEGRTAPVTCACTPDQAMSGSVWGSGIYTTDSRVCRAAVHAGVIPASGGGVNVVPAPGQTTYTGSAANGITTSNYGAWGASFTFRR
jgi:predicted nucleic acid-binding Zn ribbon protein